MEICLDNHRQAWSDLTFAGRNPANLKRKQHSYTLETEDNDSIGILCVDHAKAIPGAYKVKSIV